MNTDSTLVKLLVEFGKASKKKSNKTKQSTAKVFDSITDVISNPLKANIRQDILLEGTKKTNQIELKEGIQKLVSGLEKLKIELQTILEYNQNIYTKHFNQDHAERVVILSTLISLLEKTNAEDTKLVIIASKYHDIGRNDTGVDLSHGAKSVGFLQKHNILSSLSQENQNIVFAIIEAHSELDKDIEAVLHKYNITLKEFSRVKKLCCILKDAEALDKVRMFNDRDFVANRMLKTSMLKNKVSKQLIHFVFQLNEYYYKNS